MQPVYDLIELIIVENKSFNIDSIETYYNIFDNFSHREKLYFIKTLLKHINIGCTFYPLFISTIYEDNKSLLRYLDSDIIVNTKVYFPEFYFKFITFLFNSDYNFCSFQNDFKNNSNISTINFVKETLDYVMTIKNIENF